MTRKIFRLIYRHLHFLSFLLSSKYRLKYYRWDRTVTVAINLLHFGIIVLATFDYFDYHIGLISLSKN
jgi:hypothetical protein